MKNRGQKLVEDITGMRGLEIWGTGRGHNELIVGGAASEQGTCCDVGGTGGEVFQY